MYSDIGDIQRPLRQRLDIAEAIDNHFTVQYEMSLGGDGVSVQLVEAVEAVVDGKYVQLMEYSIN